MTWNNEPESEYESVSRISIWINFMKLEPVIEIGDLSFLTSFFIRNQAKGVVPKVS